MRRIIRIQAGRDESTPVYRPVVGMGRRLTTWPAVPMAGVGAHARRVTVEDRPAEAALMLTPVATLPCATSPALGLGPVLGALAVPRVLGTARR